MDTSGRFDTVCRTEALRALQKIPYDVRKQIFQAVFPTWKQTTDWLSNIRPFRDIAKRHAVAILKYIVLEDRAHLILKNVNCDDRVAVHEYCRHLELNHDSLSKNKHTAASDKDMLISKPSSWCLQFCGDNLRVNLRS